MEAQPAFFPRSTVPDCNTDVIAKPSDSEDSKWKQCASAHIYRFDPPPFKSNKKRPSILSLVSMFISTGGTLRYICVYVLLYRLQRHHARVPAQHLLMQRRDDVVLLKIR